MVDRQRTGMNVADGSHTVLVTSWGRLSLLDVFGCLLIAALIQKRNCNHLPADLVQVSPNDRFVWCRIAIRNLHEPNVVFGLFVECRFLLKEIMAETSLHGCDCSIKGV